MQGLGFELVYADTDSVFLKKNGASLEDFESVKEHLSKRNRSSNFPGKLLQISCASSVRG